MEEEKSIKVPLTLKGWVRLAGALHGKLVPEEGGLRSAYTKARDEQRGEAPKKD